MVLDFGRHLNILTGNNGLGKSFLLDIVWWTLTRKWPAELNSMLTSGKAALPTNKKQKAEIDCSFVDETKGLVSIFQPKTQSWSILPGCPTISGLVFYALADGSFAVWDSARNYWKSKVKERPPAYVFSPPEVWNGLQRKDGVWLCNGLIRDWANWQKEKGRAFESLVAVLDVLSSDSNEKLVPGDLTRICLDDVRDMPTLRMPYGQDVAVVHAASGIRRIISLAYFMVWCWEEHLKAKKLLGEEPETKVLFLVDEVESHLHPRWQRTVIPSLMKVMDKLMTAVEIQLFVVTHSPLIVASVKAFFDVDRAVWLNLDLVDKQVVLNSRSFVHQVDVCM